MATNSATTTRTNTHTVINRYISVSHSHRHIHKRHFLQWLTWQPFYGCLRMQKKHTSFNSDWQYLHCLRVGFLLPSKLVISFIFLFHYFLLKINLNCSKYNAKSQYQELVSVSSFVIAVPLSPCTSPLVFMWSELIFSFNYLAVFFYSFFSSSNLRHLHASWLCVWVFAE